MYAYNINSGTNPLSTSEKKRFNVPTFPLSPVLKSSVQRHHLNKTLKKIAPDTSQDKYAKCLEKLSESSKVTIDRSNYREIFHLGLSIEAIDSEGEHGSASYIAEMQTPLIRFDNKRNRYDYEFKIYIPNWPFELKDVIQSQDFVEIRLMYSDKVFRMKVVQVSFDYFTVKISASKQG